MFCGWYFQVKAKRWAASAAVLVYGVICLCAQILTHLFFIFDFSSGNNTIH
jgi:hypothetical protein